MQTAFRKYLISWRWAVGGAVLLFIMVLFIGADQGSESLPGSEGFPVTRRFAAEIAGPEDFALDHLSPAGPLLVSAFDRQHDGLGGIYAISLGPSGPGEPSLIIDQLRGCPLRPHGISLVDRKAGGLRLYVINHRQPADDEIEGCRLPRDSGGRPLLHTVEVFALADYGGLLHEATLADPLLASPNEIFATSDGQLYVSNEINAHSVVTKVLEFLRLRITSGIIHYRNGRWRQVLSGQRYANGLAVDGDRFYVAGSMDGVIDIYRRQPATGDLGPRLGRLRLDSAVDNLLWGVGPGGERDYQTLYAAAHPDRLRYMRYKFLDPEAPSPSEIYRINLAGSRPGVERIFYDDGRRLSGASVAVVYGGALYVGQFWDRGLFRIILNPFPDSSYNFLMGQEQEPTNLEQLFDRIESAAETGENVTLGAIFDAVGRRSFGALLLVAGLITLAPIIGDIPGMPTTMGILVLLTAGQLLFHRRHVWLPQWLLKRSVTRKNLCKALKWLRPPARFLDRWTRPRLTVLVGRAGNYVLGLACLGIGAILPIMEVVPFSANIGGGALTGFGLALIARDGLLALAALILTGGGFSAVIYYLL